MKHINLSKKIVKNLYKPIKKRFTIISTKVASVSIAEFYKLNRPEGVNLKIRGAAQQLSKDKAIQRRYIQQKIKQFDNDKEAIQGLEIRRLRNLSIILPYTKEHLTDIYRLDNEPVTYNQLKYKFLKKLFPTESSAITFN